MAVICLHTSTVHYSPSGRSRLMREAQEILSDRCAPESRKRLAAAFIRDNRTPLVPAPMGDDDGPRAA